MKMNMYVLSSLSSQHFPN